MLTCGFGVGVTPMVWNLLGDAMNIEVNVAGPCRLFTFVDDSFAAKVLKDASEHGECLVPPKGYKQVTPAQNIRHLMLSDSSQYRADTLCHSKVASKLETQGMNNEEYLGGQRGYGMNKEATLGARSR